MAFANLLDLETALRTVGAIDGHNIDEQCHYFAQVTGTPCPAPESFGAGDRSIRYTVGAFTALVAPFVSLTGGGAVNPPTGGGVVNPPNGGSLVNPPTGGGVVNPPTGGLTGGGVGEFIKTPMGLILVGVMIWLVLD